MAVIQTPYRDAENNVLYFYTENLRENESTTLISSGLYIVSRKVLLYNGHRSGVTANDHSGNYLYLDTYLASDRDPLLDRVKLTIQVEQAVVSGSCGFRVAMFNAATGSPSFLSRIITATSSGLYRLTSEGYWMSDYSEPPDFDCMGFHSFLVLVDSITGTNNAVNINAMLI